MALCQHLSPASSAANENAPESSHDRPAAKPSPRKHHLLMASDVPSWYAHNPYLRTGYRPVNASVKLCVDSLRFVHNETVNIFSHLIPAVIAVIGNCFLHLYFHKFYPSSFLADRVAIHLYLTTSVICFGISSVYHGLNCHSEAYFNLWSRWDYAAIGLQTIGSLVSGIYVTFTVTQTCRCSIGLW